MIKYLPSGTVLSVVHTFFQHSELPWWGGYHYLHFRGKRSERRLSKFPKESQVLSGQGGIWPASVWILGLNYYAIELFKIFAL